MDRHTILFLSLSYLLGNVPFGYLFYYFSDRKDIRREGSGNIGAANVFRTKGKAAGISIMILDIAKGLLPILYGRLHFDSPVLILAGGAMAVTGHIFPLFLKFKGGKGVATMFGVFLAFYYPAALVFLGIFLLSIFLTRYVSAGSLLGLTGIFFVILFTQVAETAIIALFIMILITIKHQANIQRLLNRSENRFFFGKNA